MAKNRQHKTAGLSKPSLFMLIRKQIFLRPTSDTYIARDKGRIQKLFFAIPMNTLT